MNFLRPFCGQQKSPNFWQPAANHEAPTKWPSSKSTQYPLMNAGATKPSRKTGFEGPEFSVFFSSKAAHGKRVWRPFKKKIICQNLYRLLLLTLHLYLILRNEVRMKIPWWRCWRWMAGNGSLRFPVRVLIFHVQEESNDEGPGKDGKVEPESREWRFSSKCENAKYERQRLKLWWNQMYVYCIFIVKIGENRSILSKKGWKIKV